MGLPPALRSYYSKEEQFWQERQEKLRALRSSLETHDSINVTGHGNQPNLLDNYRIDGRGQENQAVISAFSPSTRHAKESPETVPGMEWIVGPASTYALRGKDLEMHKRLVSLASVREAICQQVHLLQEQKVQLSEQKMAEQQRLAHSLEMRLQVAQGSLDGELKELHTRCQAIERQMAVYGRVMRGTEPEPSAAGWQELEDRFQRLHNRQSMLLDSQSFQALLESLRGQPKAEEDWKAQAKKAQAAQRKAEEELQQAREQTRQANTKASELQSQLRDCQATSTSARQEMAREVSAVQDQYEQALSLMEKDCETRVTALKDEVKELSRRIHALQTEASQVQKRPRGGRSPATKAIQMLREAVQAGPGACFEEEQEQHGATNHQQSVHGQSPEAARAPIDTAPMQRLLLDAQARFMEERQAQDTQHRQEMREQAIAHESAMRKLVLSHEEAMARLTSLLQNQPGVMAQDEREEEMICQLNDLHSTLQRTLAKMDKMREEYDTQLGYQLYEEGVKFEKKLAEVRDEAKMAAMEEVLEAQRSLQEMQVKLSDAMGPEGGPSRLELLEEMSELRVRHDQEARALRDELEGTRQAELSAERLRLQEEHDLQLESLQRENDEALEERETELCELLEELNTLREQHFASTSVEEKSAGGEPSCQGPAAPSQSTALQERGSSILTLSPSTAPTPGMRPANGQPGAALPLSPVESTASISTATPQMAAKRDTKAAARDNPAAGGMSSLVAAILSSQAHQGGAPPPQIATHADGLPNLQKTAEPSEQQVRPNNLWCVRCGENDETSPGVCRFHPFLVKAPGPFLFGPEWHLCKAHGHGLDDPGCYSRSEHYYQPGLLGSLRRSPSRGGEPHRSPLAVDDDDDDDDHSSPPKPRQETPVPTTATSQDRQ